MKSLRMVRGFGFASLSAALVSALGLGACSQGPTAGDGDVGAVTGEISQGTLATDTFQTTVLKNAACTIVSGGKTFRLTGAEACPTTVSAILDRLDKPQDNGSTGADGGTGAGGGPGADGPQVFVVSENGDTASLSNTYRFVVAGGAGASRSKLYIAPLASGRGVNQEGLEVMAWSEPLQAFVFYVESNGAWVRVGDGTMVSSSPSKDAPAFRCVACHTTGGPIMKELHDSWANWTSTWFSVVDPNSPDATFKRLFGQVSLADDLELHILQSQHLHSKGRVQRAKTSSDLKGVLSQLFCDVGEGTLIAAHFRNGNRFGEVETRSTMLPGAFVLSPLFRAPRTGGTGIELGLEQSLGLSLPTIDGLGVDPTAYKNALGRFGSAIGGKTGDAIFPMNGPEKSYADIDAVQELLRQKLIDTDFVADVLMTDFTTPAFSASRCALAQELPASWKDPADLKAQFQEKLAKSTKRGAKGLAARLRKANDLKDHTAALDAYGKACSARQTKEPAAFTEDTLRILSQRRAEFLETYASLVESDSLLPSDNLGSKPGALRFSGTTCNLEKESASFVGEGE